MFVVFLIHFQQAYVFVFDLFEVMRLLMSCNLVSKSVFVTKSAFASLALKFLLLTYQILT